MEDLLEATLPPLLGPVAFVIVTDSQETSPRDFKVLLYIVAGIVLSIGLVVLFGSVPAVASLPALTDWPSTLAPAGATLTVGGLAGLIALSAAVRWRDQRARERAADVSKRVGDRSFEVWKIRASHYDTLIISVIQQFTGSFDLQKMAADRGRAVLWGSTAVVQALEAWDVAAVEAKAQQENGGNESLSDVQKARLWMALAKLVEVMRAELPGDLQMVLPNRIVLRAIFADFRELEDKDALPEMLNQAFLTHSATRSADTLRPTEGDGNRS